MDRCVTLKCYYVEPFEGKRNMHTTEKRLQMEIMAHMYMKKVEEKKKERTKCILIMRSSIHT